MNDKKLIKEFPLDIDCDLLQHAGELKKLDALRVLSWASYRSAE